MRVQGGEFTGQSSRWKKGSGSNGTKSDYCKRAKRVLEPVLEHAELVICSNIKNSSSTGNGPAPSCETIVVQQQYCNRRKAGKPGLRILSRLRDGYVKLMNDVAMGADLAGVSSFYGAPGYGCPAVAAKVAVDHFLVTSTSPRESHLSPRRFASHDQSRPPASL